MKIKIDRTKWLATHNIILAGKKGLGTTAALAGTPHLRDDDVRLAVTQLVNYGELKGGLLSCYIGTPNFRPMADASRQAIKNLLEEFAKDPTMTTKLKAELNAFNDIQSNLYKLSSPSAPGWGIYVPDDFKGGTCHAATWFYAARAHARGKVHLKGRTLEEQGVFIERFLKFAPVLAALAGVYVVDEAAEAEEAKAAQQEEERAAEVKGPGLIASLVSDLKSLVGM